MFARSPNPADIDMCLSSATGPASATASDRMALGRIFPVLVILTPAGLVQPSSAFPTHKPKGPNSPNPKQTILGPL